MANQAAAAASHNALLALLSNKNLAALLNSQQQQTPPSPTSSNTSSSLSAQLLLSTLASLNAQPPPQHQPDLLTPLLLQNVLTTLAKTATNQSNATPHHQPSMNDEAVGFNIGNNNNDDQPLNLSTKSLNLQTSSSAQPMGLGASKLGARPFDSFIEKNLSMSPFMHRKRGRPSTSEVQKTAAKLPRTEFSGDLPFDNLSPPPLVPSSELGLMAATPPSSGSQVRGSGSGGSGKTPKRFHCGQCGRGFTRSDGLQRHLRLHSGYRPFTCTVCRRSFSRSDHAQVHLRRHFQLNAASMAASTSSEQQQGLIVATEDLMMTEQLENSASRHDGLDHAADDDLQQFSCDGEDDMMGEGSGASQQSPSHHWTEHEAPCLPVEPDNNYIIDEEANV